MFVRVYRYKIKKGKLSRWKEVLEKAGEVYERYGKSLKWTMLAKEEKDYVQVMELTYYKTKAAADKVTDMAGKDKDLEPFYNEWKEKLAYTKRVMEENYELEEEEN